jgi:hypothetical protein
MNAKLNSKGEEVWQDLRQHLDWNDGFALIFYFSSEIQLTDIFKHRLQQFFMGKSTRLHEILYRNTPDWIQQTMSQLLLRDEKWRILKAPVWIALHHTQDESALEQYRRLLMRLNERRDVWRKTYPAPMFFILPESMKATLGGIAPDLWSIRLLAEDLSDDLLQPGKLSSIVDQPPTVTQQGVKQRFVIPMESQRVIDEWKRLEKNQRGVKREYLTVMGRAIQVWLKYGWLDKAAELAEKMVRSAKELANSDTPESLRDLSISIEKLGDVAKQQGRWADAQSAYEESLGIRRRLRELLGDTPESLRDLALCAQNFALFYEAQSEFDTALKYFYEELEIGKRLTALLPDMPFYTEIEDFSRRKIQELTESEAE